MQVEQDGSRWYTVVEDRVRRGGEEEGEGMGGKKSGGAGRGRDERRGDRRRDGMERGKTT